MQNNLLIAALEFDIVHFTDDILSTDTGRMLAREYERELKKVGWDADQRIKLTKRGEFKTSTPIQVCLKDRVKVLKRIYDYYYSDSMKDYTLQQCFDGQMSRFETLASGNARSTESTKIYRSNWLRFVGNYDISHIPIRSIKASLIHDHLEDIALKQQLSTSGLRDAKTVLGKAFKFAYNKDIIPHNIMDGLDTSDIAVREVNNDERVYTDDERDKLLNVMTDPDVLKQYRKGSLAITCARALCLAFCSVIRSGEIRSLKWDDVDLTEGSESIYIHSQIRRFTEENGKVAYLYSAKTKAKKSKGNRRPSLSDFAVAILQQQRADSPEDATYVFSSNGNILPENRLNYWLKKFCSIAGVEYLSSHCIRFYGVTTMDAHGVDNGVIQHTAGHCSQAMTDHYKRHARADDLTKEQANAIFAAPTKSYQNLGIKKTAETLTESAV